jgi:hypothetical protein
MKKLNSIFFFFVLMIAFNANAQETTVSEKLSTVDDKVNGILERLATDEADLSKLNKIKVSGYIQAQYQNFESPALLSTSQNYFSLRRVRVKFTYEAADGVKFVLQPDFSPQALALKDAYVILNDHWTKAFTLWAGKFNRPNYEVEYSSSQRELTERSLIIRTLYPGERAIGAKLEFNPVNVPIHMQLAVFNGADGLTIKKSDGTELYGASNENKDYDNFKDVMARVTYNVKLGNFGGLDLGAHGYFGALKSMATTTYLSDYTTVKTSNVGDKVSKSWVGGEFQLFADILGGLSVKGEYIAGTNASIGFAPTATVLGVANFQNKFAGSYVYIIKNLGKKNQFAFRYDYYDPNTNITGKDVSVLGYAANTTTAKKFSSKSDLATTTLGFALHHYFDDNLRITFCYEIVQNEKVGTVGKIVDSYTDAHGNAGTLDWSNRINQNVFTLRLQAKF